ncbi:hypothetical protein [Oceanicola sp. S124]|uniref:hypothetical protein n=1 Tax=Oceanicola sp. S124 TaxID=1042378 RepID=UPI0002557DEA|nr:hypothetical protein [Oceanicola sp. S124]
MLTLGRSTGGGDRLARRRALTTLAATQDLTLQLDAVAQVSADFRLYDGETQMSVLPRALSDAQQEAFATPVDRAAIPRND